MPKPCGFSDRNLAVLMTETLRVLDSAHTYGCAIRGYALQRRDSGLLDSHTTRMAVPYVDTPSRGVTLGAFICGLISKILLSYFW